MSFLVPHLPTVVSHRLGGYSSAMDQTPTRLTPAVKNTAAATPKPEVPLTQRAYTLRLRGANDGDQSWREAVWATHEAVNMGAKVFGDWLLTLRGGLDRELADAKVKAGNNNPDRNPTPEERRGRRVLLALSWLSVESAPKKGDAYEKFVIASGKKDSQSIRDEKVVRALREILAKRGVANQDLEGWIVDCEPSLSAAIRDDAVWVNRSAAFDAAQCRVGTSLTREEIWDLLKPFFGSCESYLASLTTDEDSDTEAAATDDKAKDLVQKAGQWLSSRFGTGKGADFAAMSKVYSETAFWAGRASPFRSGAEALRLIAESLKSFCPKSFDADGILGLISGPGYKSATRNIIKAWSKRAGPVTADDLANLSAVAAEDANKCSANTGSKGHRPWSDAILCEVENACGFTYLQPDGPALHSEFAVMLDHAARRVSIGHSWIKRAEAERDRFTKDALRIKEVPDPIRVCLDRFCADRAGTSGAIDGYRIRKRAVSAWKEVITRWGQAACKTAEDRVIAVRETQADPDIDKFGDIQLFEALAVDDAECVWRVNGEVTPQPLIDYAAATDAEAKQKRFKVPAYRHPDPLSHPVFCDFGNSRWKIRFAAHDAVTKLANARTSLDRREADLAKAKERLDKATAPEEQTEGKESLEEAERHLRDARDRVAWLSSMHAFSMRLWGAGRVGDGQRLFWSCKRLTDDMALRQNSGQAPTIAVTRADRLGRAAAGADTADSVDILGVFTEEHWNGRLQAPRAQLDVIAAHVAKNQWDAKAKKMRDRIRWLVSFSAKLQPVGPWIEYSATFPEAALAKPFVSRKGEYAVRHVSNDDRAGLGKLVLSRLPGLRVLSVDLGHRYAAACAVWETVSIAQTNAACDAAGHELPTESDLFLQLSTTDLTGKNRTTIYRRIGADMITDPKTGEKTPHPAPWARLERQFLVKLPGEDIPARKASPAEFDAIRRLEEAFGRTRTADDPLLVRVDELLAATVDSARLALRRHGDAARIAYAFKPSAEKLTPGGGREVMSPEARKAMILDALLLWHGLWHGDRWADVWASQQWDAYIKPELGMDLPPWSETSGEPRCQYRSKVEGLLKRVAESLAARDGAGLHLLWAEQWRTRNAKWLGNTGHLRTLRSLLLPRGLTTSTPAAWNVGGLSLTRIATLKSLYQLHKAYHMRPEPEDPRKNVPAKGEEELRDFGRGMLDVMERLREQRVKQLASRLAEAALGIGRMKASEGKRDRKRPRAQIDQPCHAVVIENLKNYRPEETRTRRENRQLMSWSSSKVKKYLSEACQLNGLHLREVQASYTSRQDSRTGAPGIRCADVPVQDFFTKPWWRRQVSIAVGRVNQGRGDARERFLADLDAKWSAAEKSERITAPPLRIPVNGGELFVSADLHSPAALGLQADLNAAANIGLKALLDPDWPGKWWFVPASLDADGWRVPAAKSCAGAEWVKNWKVGQLGDSYAPNGKPLQPTDDEGVKKAEDGVKLAKASLDDAEQALKAAKKTKRKAEIDVASARAQEAKKNVDDMKKALVAAKKGASAKEIINLWRDPVGVDPADFASGEPWRAYTVYKQRVEYHVINDVLRGRAGPRSDRP